MILGASVIQTPFIERAKKKGIYVIALDRNKRAYAVDKADLFIPVDISIKEAVLSAAKECKIDGIMSPGVDFSTVSSFVAEEMNLISPPNKACETVSNKYKFRNFLKENGFSCPEFVLVNRKEVEYGISQVLSNEPFPFPLVTKPLQSMGARGVFLFDDEVDKKLVLNNTFGTDKEILIEQFLDGPEISIDGFFYNGNFSIIGFSDREFFGKPSFIEKSHTMPTCLPVGIRKEIYRQFEKMGELLNIKNGSIKGDLKIHNGEVYFIELALRSSGKSFHDMARSTYNFNPVNDLITLYMGEEPDQYLDEAVNQDPKFFKKEISMFSIPGVYKEVYTFGESEEIFTNHSPGDVLEFPLDNSKIFGTVIRSGVIGKTHNSDKINSFVRLEPNNYLTDEFINEKKFRMYKSNEKEVNWHQIHLAENFSRIFEFIDYDKTRGNKELYEYFMIGGLQAAVYYIDSYLTS